MGKEDTIVIPIVTGRLSMIHEAPSSPEFHKSASRKQSPQGAQPHIRLKPLLAGMLWELRALGAVRIVLGQSPGRVHVFH